MDTEFVVEKIADDLPFGQADGIAGDKIAEAAGLEVMGRVDTLITSPAILVDVDTDSEGRMLDDDGCGDGRVTALIKRGRNVLRNSVNKHRAKVFGGGSTMAMADLVGSDRAAGTLSETFGKAIDALEDGEIDFGAHTGHAEDGSCGCGAIDKAPAMVGAVGTYAEQIEGVVELLKDKLVSKSQDGAAAGLGALLADNHLSDIFKNFQAFSAKTAGQEYRGKTVMDQIAGEGKIIKDLEGGHLEARIILNCVRGTTVNQGLVHEVSDGKADVFAVDVWRLQDLAERLHPDDITKQQRAFQSMVVYTLSVAAILTNGKLPVYVVRPVEEPARTPEREPELTAA